MGLFGLGKKKAYERGMSAGAKPFEEKFNDLGEKVEANNAENQEKLASLDEAVKASNNNLQQATENISNVNDNVQAMNADVQATGQTVDAMLDNLTKQERFDLYQINNNYDVTTLGETERQHLIGLLYTFSGEFDVNTLQQKYIRHLQAYLEVTEPQIGVKLASVSNIDSLNTQKIYLQVMMEYDYLNDPDNYQNDALINFSVNQLDRSKISQTIENIVKVVGPEGLIEKYGLKDIDEVEAARLATEKAHQQIVAEREAFDVEKQAYEVKQQQERAEQEKHDRELKAIALKEELRGKIRAIILDKLPVLNNLPEDIVGDKFIISPTKSCATEIFNGLKTFDENILSVDGGTDPQQYVSLPTFPVTFDNEHTAEHLIFFGDLSTGVLINAWMQIFDDGTVYFEQELNRRASSTYTNINDGYLYNLPFSDKHDPLFSVTTYNDINTEISQETIDNELERLRNVSSSYAVEKIKFNLFNIINTELIEDNEYNIFQSIVLTLTDKSRIVLSASVLETIESGVFNKTYTQNHYFSYYKCMFDDIIEEIEPLRNSK